MEGSEDGVVGAVVDSRWMDGWCSGGGGEDGVVGAVVDSRSRIDGWHHGRWRKSKGDWLVQCQIIRLGRVAGAGVKVGGV